MNPQKGEVILDPACGTAGFLISAYKHILKHNSSDFKAAQDKETYEEKGVPLESLILESPMRYKGDLLTPDERKKLARDVKGYDISPDMVRLSLVNMYLHGFPEPDIEEYDTLTSEERWNDYADIILANPPFMTPKGGIRPHKRFSISASRSEVLFVDYISEHLTPQGRAAIVVPEGIIFQSGGAYKQLREMLVKNSLIAVVSLPAGVFNPYSGVKTSILILDKRLAKKTDSILFVKIENDGFGLGAQRRPDKKNDLPAAVRGLNEYTAYLQNGAEFKTERLRNFSLVEKDDISESGEYNLSADRYIVQEIANAHYPLVSLDEVFLEIKNGINVEQFDDVGKYKVTRIQTIADGSVNLEKTKWTNDDVEFSRLMQKGDILFSHINSYDHLAKTAIFEESDPSVIHGINLLRFRPDQSKIIPQYAAYLFKQRYFIEKARSFAQRAVNQASIKVSDLKTIAIPLPPIDVQREIVAEIEGYQRIIDGAKQIVTAYQPRISINPDWPMASIKDVASVESGFGFPLDYQGKTKEEIPFFKVSDMNLKGNEMEMVTWNNSVSRSTLKDLKAKSFPAGTVIFPKIGAAIATNKKRILVKEATYDNNVMGVVPDTAKLLTGYLHSYLLGFDLSKWASDSQPPSMRKTTVEDFQIPLPDPDTQKAIVAEIEKERSLVKGNNELIRLFEVKIQAAINRVWGEAE